MRKPQNFRAWLALCHDLAATALAWAAMYLAWILPLQGTIFVAFGLYRGLWRFASLLDLQRIVFAAGLGALLIPLVLVMLQLHLVVPRSVLIFWPSKPTIKSPPSVICLFPKYATLVPP